MAEIRRVSARLRARHFSYAVDFPFDSKADDFLDGRIESDSRGLISRRISADITLGRRQFGTGLPP